MLLGFRCRVFGILDTLGLVPAGTPLRPHHQEEEQTETEQEPKPFTVWVSSVGVSR